MVSTLGLTKTEWLQYRKRGIGGSDAGAVCGMNPYRTAMEVYYDKISEETEDFDNEAMRLGRDMEDYVARRFVEATGKKVRRANAMFYDEQHPFMLADVDRMIVGENAGLECKTASPYVAEQWADGKIPLSYQIQCYHYMSVCQADAWYIAVLIYGKEFKYCKIERDDQLLADLIQIEQEFWQEHVLAGKLPDPDGSKTADRVILERFRNSKAGTVLPLTGFDDKLKRRSELTALIERMEKEKKCIEQELKLYISDAEAAENEHYRVIWREIHSKRLDEKRLKTEKPEIYQQYVKEQVSRRLTIKAA